MSTGQVIHLESVDSTNEYLKRRGALLPDGTVVVADHQTAGKGRLGRRVGQQSFSVCGIGVNLLQPQEVFDGRGLPDAGSVLGVLGASLKREELLRAIGQSLQKRRAQAAAEPQALLQDVSARCITLGRTVKIKAEAGEYTAFAARLDRDGQLICQTEEGEEIKVRAGEVSVRGLNGYL